jgi:hypothetical protein
MTQYHVLASEGQQRYTIYTKTPKNIKGKKILEGEATGRRHRKSLKDCNESLCLTVGSCLVRPPRTGFVVASTYYDNISLTFEDNLFNLWLLSFLCCSPLRSPTYDRSRIQQFFFHFRPETMEVVYRPADTAPSR